MNHTQNLFAYALANEFSLNEAASETGNPKKYTWEEPLILGVSVLEKILGAPVPENSKAMLFSFGSLVLFNLPKLHHEPLFRWTERFAQGQNSRNARMFTDDYVLNYNHSAITAVNDSGADIAVHSPWCDELAATVIAKSVAMEKAEFQMEKILDRLENVIVRLERNRVRVSERELMHATAELVRHEYNTIAYIMILDRPDITWEFPDASEFYDQMSNCFELADRYAILKQKTDILNQILDNFSSISHSQRGLFVEWIIVGLILVEIVLMVAELFR